MASFSLAWGDVPTGEEARTRSTADREAVRSGLLSRRRHVECFCCEGAHREALTTSDELLLLRGGTLRTSDVGEASDTLTASGRREFCSGLLR